MASRHAFIWTIQYHENNNVVVFCWIFYIVIPTLFITQCTFYQEQTAILPRMSCWGSHAPVFTFAGCPGKRADSHFHKIFCGNSEKASLKTRLVSSGIWSLRILVPKLKYITPCLASSRKFWRSWKYSNLTATLVLCFRDCNLLFLVTALIKVMHHLELNCISYVHTEVF
jgi:hypothetical protein